ncbi:unnamed protein product [Hermetia illucens]|uniref:PiggyBac transposable element-derived protein domain-containing protein n=1 Tax=Hermetia illucens TaxID=343691 RepID=A0A7R8YUA6_HERIL|nr:unnamed protein product [Hermetia illucens]
MSNLFDFDPREDDEEESDFDPFETSTEDEEYLPEPSENDESSEYESDDDVVDNEPQQHETTCSEPKEFVLSKDGKYCYYFEPPPQLPNRSNASLALHETPGPTLFASSRCTDILSSFLLFMEPIEKTIVEMTNLYGSRKYKELWLPVDIASLRAYYGLLILAGVYRSHGQCINELWDDQTGPPIFRATMTLKKFKLINECIRFDDKEQRKGIRSRDKLAPIRNVYDKWVNRLKMCYTVGKNVTVDEQLVPFRGRCPFTQYIPSKPHKYGIKIWRLCDASTYYAWNLEVYTGRDRNCKAEMSLQEALKDKPAGPRPISIEEYRARNLQKPQTQPAAFAEAKEKPLRAGLHHRIRRELADLYRVAAIAEKGNKVEILKKIYKLKEERRLHRSLKKKGI